MSNRINKLLAILDIPVPGPVRHLESVHAYQMGDARAILSQDDGLWHLSISCQRRDPTWDEQVTLRYRLCPEVATMAMYLPPLSDYVNKHEHTFHWWEVK